MSFRFAITWLWPVIFPLAESLEIGKERKDEVCLGEEFSARCGYSEVVLITRAAFGHLYLGRCITRDSGHFGCASDVTAIVDGQCSGRRICYIQLPHPDLEEAGRECSGWLKTFLEVTYVCIKGEPVQEFCGTASAKPKPSFFFSFDAKKAGCTQRHSQTFIQIAANEGQTVLIQILNISLDVGTDAHNRTDDPHYGHVADNGVDAGFTYRRQEPGYLQAEYRSTSHVVTLVLENTDNNLIITYEATGCLEIKPPLNTWSERKGNMLTIKCYNSERSWNLKCVGTKWIGVVGNCTVREVIEITRRPLLIDEETEKEEESSGIAKEMLVVIIAATTVVMCLAVVIVGCLCVRMARKMSKAPKNYNKCEMFPITGSLSRAGGQADGNEDNIQAWQQSLHSNQSMSRSLQRNNNQQMIIMDRDLITINGINHA